MPCPPTPPTVYSPPPPPPAPRPLVPAVPALVGVPDAPPPPVPPAREVPSWFPPPPPAPYHEPYHEENVSTENLPMDDYLASVIVSVLNQPDIDIPVLLSVRLETLLSSLIHSRPLSILL